MLKLALIGLGRWGKNIQRTLEGMPSITVLPLTKGELEGVGAGIDGVIVATPGSTHAEIALPYIQQGLPVFIEKPMATSLKDAQRLENIARQHGGRRSMIFVGHIHLYNPAYVKLQGLLPKIGAIQAIHFEGLAPGPVRDDMSVLWDWGPHGVSLMVDLLGKFPKEVQAWGQTFLKHRSNLHDSVQAKLSFAPSAPTPRQFGGQASGSPPPAGGSRGRTVETLLLLSWASPEKRVKLTVIGSRGALILDDARPMHKASAGKLSLHNGDRVSYPRHSAALPLTTELKAFIRMIKTGEAPKTDAQNGLEVVRVLEAIARSISLDGKRVAC